MIIGLGRSVLSSAMRVALSQSRGVLLRPVLALDHSAYLRNFAADIREEMDALVDISVHWKDGRAETRYGEIKGFDATTSIAEDVGPHIATLLAQIANPVTLEAASIERGGLLLRLRGRCGAAALSVEMERDAAVRQRRVLVRDNRGQEARLDFGVEPGTITIGGATRVADSDWDKRASPLTLQLQEFLRLGPPRDSDFEAIRRMTAFTTVAAEIAREKQRSWLKEQETIAGEECQVAMRELLAPPLVSLGLIPVGNSSALETAAAAALSGDAQLQQLAGAYPLGLGRNTQNS